MDKNKNTDKRTLLSEEILAVMTMDGKPAVSMNGVSPTLPLDEIQKLAAAQHAQGVKSVAPASNPGDLAGPPASGSAGAAPTASPAANAGAAANVVNAAKQVANADDKFAAKQGAQEDEDENAAEEPDSDEDVSTDEEDEEKTKKLKESLQSIFKSEGVELSENFFEDVTALFEAAVAEKTNAKLEKLVPVLEERFNEYANGISVNLVQRTDEYLNYVVEEFMEQHKITLENGFRNQICENFMNGLKNLFESCYIDMPDEKLDIFKSLFEKAKNIEDDNKNLLEENIQLKNQLFNSECANIFQNETKELADTQVEKLQDLMESVSFSTVDEFKNKLQAVKTHYLNSVKTDSKKAVMLGESITTNKESPKTGKNPTNNSTFDDEIVTGAARFIRLEDKK